MDRRGFLKVCGKAGLVIGAGGALSQLLTDKAFAQVGAVGGPLLIRLKGSPSDMGKQYADQARDLILARLKLMREKGGKVPAEWVEMSRVFLNIKANSIYMEIAAMAERLDEKEEDLLMLSAEPPGVGIRQSGCSSFVLDKKVAKDGQVWMGQNIDDTSELEKFGVVIVRRPLEQPPSITWALAGGVGAIGMNLCGLAVLMNYVQAVSGRVENGIFPEFVANAALRQKQFKDVMGVLTETQIMTSVAYLAASREGDRTIVERTPLRFAAWAPGGNYMAYTNHLDDESMRGDDQTAKTFPDSKARLKRLGALLAGKQGVETPDFLKKVLGDTEGKPLGICRHASPRTIASVIMCLKENRLYATKGGPDVEQYKEFVLTAKE